MDAVSPSFLHGQVVSDLNRFGGAMGPYTDSMLQLRTGAPQPADCALPMCCAHVCSLDMPLTLVALICMHAFLSPAPPVEYINATPIDNLPSGHRFIATMCPKRSTFAHFWAMVWEMSTAHVINLTHDADKVGSGAYDKRERYWPPFDAAVAAEAAAHWLVRPELIGAEHCPTVPGLSRYALRLHHRSGEQRSVQVLWYSRWVDFPDSHMIGTEAFYRNAAHVLALTYTMRDMPLDTWPVVHCSAGVGRTGTFIVLCAAHRARSLALSGSLCAPCPPALPHASPSFPAFPLLSPSPAAPPDAVRRAASRRSSGFRRSARTCGCSTS